MTAVIRAVVFEYRVEAEAEASVEASGLRRWLGGSTGTPTRVRHRVLRMTRVGLIVQHPPRRLVEVMWQPIARVTRFGPTLCRYHDGPRGVVEKHEYCTRVATTSDGFCEEHRSSPMALYEKCATGSDEACVKVSMAWPDEEYVIYILDYGGDRVKTGLTRRWRLLWRIAEQPHVAATAAKTLRGDAYMARRLEKEYSAGRLATQGMAIRLRDRLLAAVSLLETASPQHIAQRLAEILNRVGFTGTYESYTILPMSSLRTFLAAPQPKSLEELLGRRLLVKDYWAGLLLLEDIDTGELLVVDKKSIQHRLLYTEKKHASSTA